MITRHISEMLYLEANHGFSLVKENLNCAKLECMFPSPLEDLRAEQSLRFLTDQAENQDKEITPLDYVGDLG